ncbi:MAG: hypothetical protein PVJ95_14220 [Cellvibrionales bacterium]|jgi:hypothetical protein
MLLMPSRKQSRILDNRVLAERWAATFDRLWLAGAESQELRQFY